MRFVEIKTEDQQAILSIHRTRDLAVRQRTQLANMIRSLLREFGHILPIGIEAVTAFAKRHLDGDHPDMPEIANGMLGIQCYQFIGLNERIDGYSKMIEQHALLNADARRLMRMPGIGPITASAIVATIGDAKQFRTGRDLAAWLGLTPLNKSSGGKERAIHRVRLRRSVASPNQPFSAPARLLRGRGRECGPSRHSIYSRKC